MAEDHRNKASIRPSSRFSPYVVPTALAALLALLVAYALLLVPLQKKVLGHEALAVAQELDAGVQARSAALDVALHDMGLDRLLQTKALDNVVKTVRGRFPDILSMDVIADDGTILAMIGEVPVSEAGLFRIADTTRFVRADAAAFTWGWAFSDDAAGSCFHMTRMASSLDGRNWFVRARFAREWVSETMGRFAEGSGLRLALVPLALGSKGLTTDRTGEEWSGVAGRASVPMTQLAVSGSWWWTGPTTAEARLRSSGWLVRAERHQPFPIVILLACSVVLLGLAGTGLRFKAFVASIKAGAPPVVFPPPATVCEQPCPGEFPPAKGVVGLAAQDSADEIQHQAVFFAPTPAKLHRADPVEGANPHLPKPASGEDGTLETRAVRWFEPEPEEESAESVIADHGPAHPEEGLMPEYLDVEWTEHSEEPARTEPRSAEGKARVAPRS